LDSRVEPQGEHHNPGAPVYAFPERPYAYIARYESVNDLKFLAAILQSGVKVRAAEKEFQQQGQTFNQASLVITRNDNQHLPDFDNLVSRSAEKLGRPLVATSSGWVDQGKDFGSSSLNFFKKPVVAVLQSDSTHANSFGEI